MKNLISILSILLCTEISVSGQTPGWQNQVSGTTEKLNSVYFVTDSIGWIVGRKGKILKTTDAGANWITQTSNTLNELKSVMFYDQLIGWCSGDMGKVYKTGDGGLTWTQYSTGTSARLNSISFASVSEGWACGEYGVIVHTTDGGQSWLAQNSGQWSALTSIRLNSGIGRITMMGGQILVTNNGGANWNVENLNTASTINSVWFSDLLDGIAVGDNGTVSIHTGPNWETSQVFSNKNMMSVFMNTTDTGWCAGQFGSIYFTVNGGGNWVQQVSGTTQDMNSLFFTNSNLGWACGNNGTILRTTSGGIITSLDENADAKMRFSLGQNFPNPFCSSTKIEYRVSVPTTIGNGFVSLKVYDFLGKLVETLIEEEKPSGEYEIEFSAKGLPAGVYFYQLQAAGIYETKKMIILK